MERVTADSDTGSELDKASLGCNDDLPWASPCRDSSAALLEQFIRNVAKPIPRLDRGDVSGFVQGNIEHPIKLDH